MSEIISCCKKRMAHLKRLMIENDVDLTYLIAPGSYSFTSEYKKLINTTFGNALIIPRDGDPVLLCNETDYEGSKSECWIEVILIKDRSKTDEEIINIAESYLTSHKSRFGINMTDRVSLSVNSYKLFKERLKGEMVDITTTILAEVFQGLYPEEIKFQRKVGKIADVSEAAVKEILTPGIKEVEIAAEANNAMMRNGAGLQWFPTLISSGERSAFCHAFPTERKVKEGDFVMVDLGPVLNGYAADETRTYLVGNEDVKKRKMLIALDQAVETVLNMVKPGVSCKELDAISRRVLNEQGFPDYPHGMGHALSGCMGPILDKKSKYILKEGMAFTVEPGIYLPNYGGVRLEENVVITHDGFEQLTRSPRL